MLLLCRAVGVLYYLAIKSSDVRITIVFCIAPITTMNTIVVHQTHSEGCDLSEYSIEKRVVHFGELLYESNRNKINLVVDDC